ncbi:MAG: amidohydrolase [Oscillospiraceae bacterium]|nr:amidohydrolase [Oscillospiraceae bacterium]
MDYLKRAHELHEVIKQDRRTIHACPELGLEVPQTSAYIRKRLAEMGIESQLCGKYGVTALIGKKEDGPVLMLRADIDALPMDELSGLPFASQNPGKAHCCGHDTHAAMLLGAAQMLKENEDALQGRIKLVFQPGEETGEGCQEMLANGVLENPVPDAALGLHIDAGAPLCLVNWGKGPTFCSNDVFDIEVTGVSCHGARPHQGKDAINCACHLVLNLEALIAREADPSETDILTICSIESSDKVFNVFPTSVTLKGSLRTYNNEQRAYLLQRLEEVCEYTGKTFGCQCELKKGHSMNAVILSIPMEEEILGYLKETWGDEAVISDQPIRKMGSDDFAGITCQVPSAYFFVGAGPDREHEYPYIQHHPMVVFNEDAFPIGASGLAAAAEKWLANHAK